MENQIQFTESAVQKIQEIMSEEANPQLALRIFITGGGCSGFQYGFTLDDQASEEDYDFQQDGVRMLVDAMSMQYLSGASVDYTEDVAGSQFVIKNPNAANTCGCGSSFSPA